MNLAPPIVEIIRIIAHIIVPARRRIAHGRHEHKRRRCGSPPWSFTRASRLGEPENPDPPSSASSYLVNQVFKLGANTQVACPLVDLAVMVPLTNPVFSPPTVQVAILS